MTLEALQTEVEKRYASFMLACTGAGRLAVVTLTEHPDHADERNARPSDRWYGSGTNRSFAKAVDEAIKAYDDSIKRLVG